MVKTYIGSLLHDKPEALKVYLKPYPTSDNFQVGYYKVLYYILLQNKPTKNKRTALYKITKITIFNTIHICSNMTVFVQKGSDDILF